MKINFANVKVYQTIDHEKYSIVDLRSELANAIFRFGSGMNDHALCHKIYESKAEDTEYSDAEIESIKNIVYTTGNPVMIESVKELLED